MSKSPHNAGQTIEIEHLIHGPVSTVDLAKITVTENWGRLFIKQGDSNEVVIERGAYVALRDAIDHFIEPQPDPRTADYEQAYQYALTFADALISKHYPDNKDWRPLGDLTGLLTQIDNMVAGKKPDPRDEVIARLVEAADECSKALKDYMKQYPHMVKGYLVDAEQHASAALAAAKKRL